MAGNAQTEVFPGASGQGAPGRFRIVRRRVAGEADDLLRLREAGADGLAVVDGGLF